MSIPIGPFTFFRASRSGDKQILSSSGTSCDGIWLLQSCESAGRDIVFFVAGGILAMGQSLSQICMQEAVKARLKSWPKWPSYLSYLDSLVPSRSLYRSRSQGGWPH